jgi:hypothetical protein
MATEVDDDGAKPYNWDEAMTASPEVLQLWTEVGNGLDKNQTGVYLSVAAVSCGLLSVSQSFLRTVQVIRAVYGGFF